MPPSIAILLMLIAGSLGAIIYSYNKGEKSCILHYEYQIAQTALKNKEKEAANYKEQVEYNEILVREANKRIVDLEKSHDKLKEYISSIANDNIICVSREFLQQLQQLRGTSIEKNNTKSTK